MSRQDEKELAKEIAAQKEAGWPLRKQLLWRIEKLTQGQELDLGEYPELFPEILDGFTAPGLKRPILVSRDGEGKLISKGTLENGGAIVVTGSLALENGDYVGSFKRRLQFEQNWALHEQLYILPEFRGQRIGPRFVLKSLELYDALELNEIHVVAALETGRWLWAHMGFDFYLEAQRLRVRAWAGEVCQKMGLETPGIGADSSAGQFARLDCGRKICLEELAVAMPSQRERLENEVAAKNGYAMSKPIPLGQAIMLTGPAWRGFLQLEGPQRLAFEEAARERMEEQAQAQPDLPPDADGSEISGDPGRGYKDEGVEPFGDGTASNDAVEKGAIRLDSEG